MPVLEDGLSTSCFTKAKQMKSNKCTPSGSPSKFAGEIKRKYAHLANDHHRQLLCKGIISVRPSLTCVLFRVLSHHLHPRTRSLVRMQQTYYPTLVANGLYMEDHQDSSHTLSFANGGLPGCKSYPGFLKETFDKVSHTKLFESLERLNLHPVQHKSIESDMEIIPVTGKDNTQE